MLNNKTREIKGIIFDFDYTLADSSKGVIKCVNYALSNLGLADVSEKEINKTIGLSLGNTFKKLSGNDHIDKIEKFKHYFIEKADEVMTDLTTLYIETPKVIKILDKKGFKLGIVSTKFSYRIESILLREDLLDFFEVIIGGEDVKKLKPHPFGLLLAVRKLNLKLSDVVFIGDSITDSEAAHRAGISFIALLSGVTLKNTFKQSHVNYFIESLSDLPNLLGIK
ncbi:MAG: HAD family hydrolase [Promethearchaeota archaeon]